MQARIIPLGDTGITIIFGDAIDEEINQRVFSVFHYLQKQNLDYIRDILPAYASLSVVYDIVKIREMGESSSYHYMHHLVQTILQQVSEAPLTKNRTIHVPVCYDVSLGFDVADMSRKKNLSIEEIGEIHSATTYRVYMLGFLPGFAYMGKVNDKIATPRKAVPDKNVPAGSVGIADAQTGIYPVDSPGGWNIIGRTPLKMFDVYKAPPCLFQPGDEVKFKPITLNEFHQLKK